MNREIKELLDAKYDEYCRSEFFIETDPIQIPKQFTQKEDIEIAGFLTASLAWGQRPVIIKKCLELMQYMDYAPYDFIMNVHDKELRVFSNFKHRTFNGEDCLYFIRSLMSIYREYNGLKHVFTQSYLKHGCIKKVLQDWYKLFSAFPHHDHVLRHIANVDKGSAAKRMNMFLRWMVRCDNRGIDFGIWNDIAASDLLIPLDVHSGNVSRELGLLTIKQNNIKAVYELTDRLREFDSKDPIKYDYALFGLGAFNIKK